MKTTYYILQQPYADAREEKNLTMPNLFCLQKKAKTNEHQEKAKQAIVVWAHGWGQNHMAFQALAEGFAPELDHYLFDLPGFGESTQPSATWSTKEYAQHLLDWLAKESEQPIIWIGHSFGCRVGLQAAALAPNRFLHLVCIAGAGLQKKRSFIDQIKIKSRIRLFKFLKKFLPDNQLKTDILKHFGSSDYNTAGTMKNIFIKTVNEDLSEVAKSIQTPTTLIYGDQDQETPVEFGQRYEKMMSNAKLFVLNRQNHYTLLSDAQHQVLKIMNQRIFR